MRPLVPVSAMCRHIRQGWRLAQRGSRLRRNRLRRSVTHLVAEAARADEQAILPNGRRENPQCPRHALLGILDFASQGACRHQGNLPIDHCGS